MRSERLQPPIPHAARELAAATLLSRFASRGPSGAQSNRQSHRCARPSTPKSGGIVGVQGWAGGGFRLARLWLVGMAMLTSQAGCLLGDPAEYQSRRQTPPVLLTTSADPPLTRIIRAKVNESVEFKVIYRSEDAGETMGAILIRNFRVDGALPTRLNGKEYEPSSNLYPDEGEATQASTPYTFGQTDLGCNSYTMLLTHSSNLDVLGLPRTNDDVAFVTWWANVSDANSTPGDTSVDSCGGEL